MRVGICELQMRLWRITVQKNLRVCSWAYIRQRLLIRTSSFRSKINDTGLLKRPPTWEFRAFEKQPYGLVAWHGEYFMYS